jgi:ribonuclease HII
MSTTSIGKEAEGIAAEWLRVNGYHVLDLNWRTRWCEIDVIAQKGGVMYFVEVRYRKTSGWGDGVDSITAKKQQQMEFAANLWLNQNGWNGDARLSVIAVEGSPAIVTSYLEL